MRHSVHDDQLPCPPLRIVHEQHFSGHGPAMRQLRILHLLNHCLKVIRYLNLLGTFFHTFAAGHTL